MSNRIQGDLANLSRENADLRQSLQQLTETLQQAREELDRVAVSPRHPAIVLEHLPADGDVPRVLVFDGARRRIVTLLPEIDGDPLTRGEEVHLDADLGCILHRPGRIIPRGGETASFVRSLEGGRAVLRSRDDDLILDLAGGLEETLERGDLVRFDRATLVAFEKVPRDRDTTFRIDQGGLPVQTFEDLGGLDDQIARLRECIDLSYRTPGLAQRYRVPRVGSILLTGVPGNGKTSLARATAHWLSRDAAGPVPFLSVKPGELNSMWFGETERHIRDLFRTARDLAEQGFVLLFLDEVDALGLARGTGTSVLDRILPSFMAELDGLEDRGNILVMAATNRRDLLDGALVRAGRLGDLELEIPRPGRDSCRAILGRHLHPDLPYHVNGRSGSQSREAMIAAATARLFDPDHDAVATLHLGGGTSRALCASQVVSCALLAAIASEARRAACLRELRGGAAGLRETDLVGALEARLASLARTLTPSAVRELAPDLPYAGDVVSVGEARPAPARKEAQRHGILQRG